MDPRNCFEETALAIQRAQRIHLDPGEKIAELIILAKSSYSLKSNTEAHEGFCVHCR